MRDRLTGFFDERLVFATLSQRRKSSSEEYKKVQIKPFYKNSILLFQFTYVYNNKVTHKNLAAQDAVDEAVRLLENVFHQGLMHTTEHDYHMTSFAKLKIKTQPPTKSAEQKLTHDKQKNYIIADGEPCDFLIHLGVMSREGRVLKSKYDKFRQINKYLELVADCVDMLPKNRRINLVDFGCGKSYLTFALYYYLVKLQGMDVNIIGLDLKRDVVDYCEQVAVELGYSSLHFLTGDIQSFVSEDEIDMVVTLHACDTATDAAIVQAVCWDCRVLLTVPCCQHELFDKISNDDMQLLTKHGIIKERLSSLITDSIRAELLEACGYDTGVMEFISMEHTPKNIMIKAVRSGSFNRAAYERYLAFARMWQIEPYLERELICAGRIPGR